VNIQRANVKAHNMSFSGHKKSLDKTGYVKHDFFYLFDPKKYNCEVELYNINKDKNGNFSVAEKDAPAVSFEMKDGKQSVDMSEVSEITSDEGFAYRFKLTDKQTGKESYAYDNGTLIGLLDLENTDNKYNVVLNNRATINKNGPMQLIMPDGYYPGVVNNNGKMEINEALRAKALVSVRNHANKLGGQFAGIIKRLPEISKEGVSRIVGTPFTKDSISSHKYWTENAFQVSPDFGTEEDFKLLQEELFKNDINWVSDAALVNEGFGGVHLSEVLRKGQDSTAKNMFRTDERISLGILPDNCDYTRMKIINPPFDISKEDGNFNPKNENYNPAKPTYIQFYDDRLASENQKKSNSPLDLITYENKNTDNIYDITKHDDAVYPFPIEVSPYELSRNVKNIIKEKGELDLSNLNTIQQVANFTNFNVVKKSQAAGLEVWDGNVDIAKLNFYRCGKDDSRFTKLPAYEKNQAIEDFDRGTLAVRDYAINSGKYWTKLTSDSILEYTSKAIAQPPYQEDNRSAQDYMDNIKSLVNEGKLPKSTLEKVDTETIQNVLDDNYHSRLLDDADVRNDINTEDVGNQYSLSDYILRQAMDVPIETLPVAPNLLGVMSSPYIEKKANTEDELGVSRYDLTKAGNPNLPDKYSHVYSQMDNIYENGIVPIVEDVIKDIDGITDEDGNVTDYGKYVLSEITPGLTKYVIVKALSPNSKIKSSGEHPFDFTKVKAEDITMQSIGIPYEGMTEEEEAQTLVNALKKGIKNFKEEDFNIVKDNIKTRFNARTLNDFKVAEMIMDRTEAGLGWRIDAAKDVASIDSVRADVDTMTDSWINVIDFWKRFNQGVLEYNPHSYTTAEITDLGGLFANEDKTIFTSDADAERKFLEETGITSVANYNYFFSYLPDLFSLTGFEAGGDNYNWQAEQEKNSELLKKMDFGWCGTNPGFLFQSPEDGVINSYTFFGNHDKYRALHCLSLDMNLFYSDFSKEEDRQLAAKCLKKDENSIDFDKVSSRAIAMGTRLNDAFAKVVKDKDELEAITDAISDLASGKFKDSTFDADAFGTRPFEIAIRTVLDEVKYNNQYIENRKTVEAKVLKEILEPAFDRYSSMYKLLVALPGSPTEFAGDRVGSSGLESKAKNYHQQNRNIIPWEWLSDDKNNEYKFVKEFYDQVNEIANLRNKKELSALNDGATVTLPVIKSDKYTKDGDFNLPDPNEKIQAILRYNDKGSVVLTIHDVSGANTPKEKKMNRKDTETSIEKNSLFNRIILDADNYTAKQGLKHGLEVGTTFKNERDGDNSSYKIATMKKNGKEYYYLKRLDNKGKEIPITIKPEDLNTLILYKV
jgi:hypothetical protein